MLWIIPFICGLIVIYFIWRKIRALPEIKHILEKDAKIAETKINISGAQTDSQLAKEVRKVDQEKLEKDREEIQKFNTKE